MIIDNGQPIDEQLDFGTNLFGITIRDWYLELPFVNAISCLFMSWWAEKARLWGSTYVTRSTKTHKKVMFTYIYILWNRHTRVYIYIYYTQYIYIIHTLCSTHGDHSIRVPAMGANAWWNIENHKKGQVDGWRTKKSQRLASYSVITSLHHRKLEITIKFIVFQS